MIRLFLRDLLRAFRREHALDEIKLQKSKLLIYDEYLKKYVSADELLIPGIKGKNKGAVTRTKPKELLIFDILFKKFVNPKLDLLVPGIKNLDLLIKGHTSNKPEEVRTSSRDYFWGKKTSKKHAVFPLPTVHCKDIIETEPAQMGWAGQKTIKPKTDPRPEMGKSECKLGPGKDPKKKKPPKKKSKKDKYLICGKVKKTEKYGINKTDAEQLAIERSMNSTEITYNEENCYSNLKGKEKPLKSQDSTNDVSKTPIKSVVKETVILENLMHDSEKNKTNDGGVFKIICSKLFSNDVNVKDSNTKESISDPHSKLRVVEVKTNTSTNLNENSLKEPNETKNVTKHESDLKSNQSKALVCKRSCPSSLIPSEDSKTTNRYLCKERKENQNNKGITECFHKKEICPTDTASTNKINCKNIKPVDYKKEDKTNDSHSCCNRAKVDESNCIKYTNIDQIKHECKKAITKKSSTSTIETLVSSKAKDQTLSNKIELGLSKSTLPYNFMQRPKTAFLQKPCSKATSLATSGDCKSDNQNATQGNDKSDNKKEEPCKCSNAEKSKVKEKCKETNGPEKHKSLERETSQCLKIDPKSTEKLENIAQEESFNRADLTTDLTKCSSYMGFKVKKTSSKNKPTTENDCKKALQKKVHSEKKVKSKTALKAIKSHEDCTKPKTDRDSCRASKSESFLNEKAMKKTLKNMTPDCKEVNTKSTCTNNISLSTDKQESKSKTIRGSDSKDNLQERKNKLSQRKSLTKSSKKCKGKSSLDVEEDKLKSKEVRKNKDKKTNEKSSVCTNTSVSSGKEPKENIKNDAGKDGSCCKDLTNREAQGQAKQVQRCKKTEKEVDKTFREKSPTSYDCLPASGKNTAECPTTKENSKGTTMDKNNTKDEKANEINKNKKKAKPKDCIITGATQRKKTTLCKKIKSFQSFKSQGNKNKTNKTKISNTSPENLQKKKEPLEKIKKSKNVKVCSDKKPSGNADLANKKTKSKHSICSKTDSKQLLGLGKNASKSKKEENVTKLNKLVRRAKCNTVSGKRNKEIVTQALICSKSTPSIKPLMDSKISGPTKRNEAIPKKPSTANTSNNISKKVKSSKNEMKSTQMCSLHTLQKRTAETLIKTSKRIDSKSFSELKTINSTNENYKPREHHTSVNRPSQLNMKWNKQNTDGIRVKDTVTSDDCKLENAGLETEQQNSLKISNWGRSALFGTKNKNLPPTFKNDKYFQLLLNSLTHGTGSNKYKTKNTFKLDTKASLNNNNLKTGKRGEATLMIKSLNNVKEYSNDRFNDHNITNKWRDTSISLVSKEDTNNVYRKNKTVTIHTKDARPNEKKIMNSNKIAQNGFQDNNKFKRTALCSSENMDSSLNGVSKEAGSTGFHKAEGWKNQPQQAIVSKVQLKATNLDTSNKDKKSVTQTIRAKTAAPTKSVNKSLSIPSKNLSLCKTKSFSSFNATKLHDTDTDTKHMIRPLLSSKSKDFEVQTLETKNSTEQESINPKMCNSSHTKTSDKIQLMVTKYEKSANSCDKKMAETCDKRGFDYRLVARKEPQHYQVNEAKHLTKTSNSLGQSNGLRNNIGNETILCDFIEGALDVVVQNTEPQYLGKSINCIINQNLQNLKTQTEFKKAEKENKPKQCITVGKNDLRYNNVNKKESSKVTLTNKIQLINDIEKHGAKLDTIVPSMKRIVKPVYLNREERVGNEKQELNKNILAVKTLGKPVSKELETERKDVIEKSNIKPTKSSVKDETAGDRTTENVKNAFVTPNNAKKLQEIAMNKCLNFSNTLEPNLKKNTIKMPEETTKTPIKNKYSPKSNNKVQLISERHTKYTKNNYKRNPFTIVRMDNKISENSELNETIEANLSISNKYNKIENQDSVKDLNTWVTASLSSKQSKLLSEQPFYKKKTEYESPSANVLHITIPETTFVALNKDNPNGDSSPKHSAKQLRLLTEQPFNKQPKSESYTDNSLWDLKSENSSQISKQLTGNKMHSSKSENRLQTPKHLIGKELHSSKSENNMVAPNTKNMSGLSPRKQQSSIRSQLKPKTPTKAEIRVNLKNTEQDK